MGTKVYDDNDELITELHVERRIFVPLAQDPEGAPRTPSSRRRTRASTPTTASIRPGSRAPSTRTSGADASWKGGSTITQQLAKVLFLTPDKSLERKLKEAVLALTLERRYSKDRLLELYLNQIYFGSGAFGVEAAAQTFFGKSVTNLTLSESALLAGLAQGARPPTRPSIIPRPRSAGAPPCWPAWSRRAR